VQVTAKADYAVRALAELAAAGPAAGPVKPVKAELIAQAQGIPLNFLENILLDLRHAGLVTAQRGSSGGYALARPPDRITLADAIRAVDGPLANVRGQRPDQLEYAGSARLLREVWIAVRANLRAVLERVTVADLVAGALPPAVAEVLRDPDAWTPH
jgi:Rrf2 family protein